MRPQARPPLRPTPPSTPLPSRSCDAHFHIVADASEFPRYEARVEDPADGRFEDWLTRLRDQMQVLGLDRGVVVQSILYGTRNNLVARTIQEMGPSSFRGIGVVADEVTPRELDTLRSVGIVGLRLNYVHGGVMTWQGARALSDQLCDRGMHVQMLVNAGEHMADLAEDIRKLSVPVVLDHMGWPDLAAGTDEPGFEALLGLVADGAVWVKLSGCFRFCDAPYEEADAHVAALVEANPERCLWGSDWPYLMMADAKTPDPGKLLDALFRAMPNDTARDRIMVDNPAELYGFERVS